MKTVPIQDVAEVVRSKNASPFEITLDILFRSPRTYAYVKGGNFFTAALFAALYGVSEKEIVRVAYFDAASAVKCTMVRRIPSGSPGDTDVYGAQQHAPLLTIRVPVLPDAPGNEDPAIETDQKG